jgi:hypothetical protein
MNRNVALAVMLASLGAFVLLLMFRGEAWHWPLPPDLRRFVSQGYAAAAALIVGLVAAYRYKSA